MVKSWGQMTVMAVSSLCVCLVKDHVGDLITTSCSIIRSVNPGLSPKQTLVQSLSLFHCPDTKYVVDRQGPAVHFAPQWDDNPPSFVHQLACNNICCFHSQYLKNERMRFIEHERGKTLWCGWKSNKTSCAPWWDVEWMSLCSVKAVVLFPPRLMPTAVLWHACTNTHTHTRTHTPLRTENKRPFTPGTYLQHKLLLGQAFKWKTMRHYESLQTGCEHLSCIKPHLLF